MTDNKHTRDFAIKEHRQLETDGKIRIAISSETPYLARFAYGFPEVYEILGHREDEVDLSYFENGAPLILEHNKADQIGVLENVSLDPDRVLRADVRFSKSQKAQEIKQDVLDGIRSRVSVGYSVKDYTEIDSDEFDRPAIRATNWRPYEASIVAIPADITVGVGRSLETDEPELRLEKDGEEVDAERLTDDEIQAIISELAEALEEFKKDVDEEGSENDEDVEETSREEKIALISEMINELRQEPEEEEEEEEIEDSESEEEGEEDEEDEEVTDEIDDEEEESADSEEEEDEEEDEEDAENSNKSTNILINTRSYNGGTRMSKEGTNEQAQLARIANEYGRTEDLPGWLEAGRSVADVMEQILDERSNAHKVQNPVLSDREEKEFSIARSIEGLMSGDNSLVNEMGRDVAKAHGIDVQSNALYIPLNTGLFKRTYQAGSGQGSNVASQQYLTFEEAVREQSILGQLGVDVQEVNGELTLPRAGGATPTWVGENTQVSQSSGSITTIKWSPKTLALDVPYTRQLGNLDAIHSIEEIVRQDVLGALMEGMEEAIFQGSGSLEPEGLEYDSNIDQVAVATGSAITYDDFISLAGTQAENKGSQNGRFYVMPPSLYATAVTKARWSGSSGPGIIHEGKINGIPAIESNFVTLTDGSGTNDVARVVFGNFSRVLVAHFGVVELTVNPYRQSDYRRNTLEGTLFMDSHARRPDDLVVHLGLNPTL